MVLLVSEVVIGPAGRRENVISPFDNLPAQNVFDEVMARGLIDRNFTGKLIKKNLESLLKDFLRGVVRPPALCHGDVMESMESLNLSMYEVSQVEPLHDLKGHIRNVWDLLPSHLPGELKKTFEEKLAFALGEHKDKYRGCDYRISVISVYSRMRSKFSTETEELLYTLKEICRLSYLQSTDRSSKTILRLYNMTFLHYLRCLEIFGEIPRIGKVYGSYYDSLVIHLPEHYRIIALSSLYTESEERIFNGLRGIGRDTTNRHKESVRDMGIVRYQAEKNFQQKYCHSKSHVDSKFSK
eukprot:TCONS_00002532-protein